MLFAKRDALRSFSSSNFNILFDKLILLTNVNKIDNKSKYIQVNI